MIYNNNRIQLLAATLLLLGISPAMAQTAPSYLESLKSAAEADLAAATKALDDESRKGKDFSVCVADELKFRAAYDTWFIKHYTTFNDINTTLDDAVANAMKKLNDAKGTQVETLASEGQSTAPKIGVQAMIDYFKNLNERLAGVTDAQRDALMTLQNDPTMNTLHVSHKQVLSAMQTLTTTMNASLHDMGATYEIGFKTERKHFDLILRIKADFQGVSEVLNISLLDDSSGAFTDQAKWQAVVKSGLQIDGMPIDAVTRFREMQAKQRLPECRSTNWAKLPFAHTSRPFVLADDMNKVASEKIVMSWGAVPAPIGMISSISATQSGDLYAVVAGSVWFQNKKQGNWEQVAPGIVSSAVAGNDGRIYGVNLDGKVVVTAPHGSWSEIGNPWTSQIAVADKTVYGLDANGNIQKMGARQGWQTVMKSDFISFAALDNGVVFGLKRDGSIVRTDGKGSEPKVFIAKSELSFASIAARSDETLFGLTRNGELYYYNGSAWNKIISSSSSKRPVIAFTLSTEDLLCGLTSDGKIFCLR